MPAWASVTLTVAAVVVLAVFVAWGATISPNRPFSWGMYSGSSKGYLWSGPDDPTVLPPHRLLIAPTGHYLTVPELRNLLEGAGFDMPLHGLIVGSDGGWRVDYDPGRHRLRVARLPAGHERRVLADALGGAQ